MAKKILAKVTPEFVAAYNGLTSEQALGLLCRDEVTKRVSGVIALTKSAIGMCVDQKPYLQIQRRLHRLLTELRGFSTKKT